MKIRAESFLGRVLAVFSRRSPGFQRVPQVGTLPELRYGVVHADLTQGRLKACRHSGDTMPAALRDARECAGVPIQEETLVNDSTLMALGMAMSIGNHAFVAKGMTFNPWGLG